MSLVGRLRVLSLSIPLLETCRSWRPAEQLAESCEEDGGSFHSDALTGESLDAVTPLLQATITTTDGRLPEVHRSILARQVLHLPGCEQL
jgi:hypothetical protein